MKKYLIALITMLVFMMPVAHAEGTGVGYSDSMVEVSDSVTSNIVAACIAGKERTWSHATVMTKTKSHASSPFVITIVDNAFGVSGGDPIGAVRS